jgi:hypothetical protein
VGAGAGVGSSRVGEAEAINKPLDTRPTMRLSAIAELRFIRGILVLYIFIW